VGLLDGKVAVIVGVRDQRGFGWQVAQAFAREGAALALTCREHSLERVRRLLGSPPKAEVYLCDVRSDEDIGRVFDSLRKRHGGVDVVVHSLASANRADISGGRFVDTSRAGFSLTALARAAEPLLGTRGGGSILTMTYLGSERVIPNYHLMGVAKAALECSVRYLAHDLGPSGIRVNAISVGPQRTLAARAIASFSAMTKHAATHAPLRRGTDGSDVGNAALFLCSDLGRSVTGKVLHVDAGYNVVAT